MNCGVSGSECEVEMFGCSLESRRVRFANDRPESAVEVNNIAN